MARGRAFSVRMRTILHSPEIAIFDHLGSPDAIQDYLDNLPINFEDSGETYFSPRRVIREGTAHCFEGALLAAAALAYHGKQPLLMDFQTLDDDQDHVVALFRESGRWGAISKTNHAVLRYRDPIYRSPRELAMSYFHEYFLRSGKKTLAAYSAPFNLSRFAPERWITAEEDLHWLVGELDHSRHLPTVSHNILASLRSASRTEVDASYHLDWRAQNVRARRGERG